MKNYWKLRCALDKINWLTAGMKCSISIDEDGNASALVYSLKEWESIPCDDIHIYEVKREERKRVKYYEKFFDDKTICINTNETFYREVSQ